MRKGIIFLLSLLIILGGCKKEEIVTTGFLKGVVTDKTTGDLLPDVRIIVFDANTNAPTGTSYLTNSEGVYEIELDPGTYFLKLYRLGFNCIPEAGRSAIPLTVHIEESIITNFTMTKNEITNGGIISGKIETAGSSLSGVLVIAENNEIAVSSVSDGEGNYYIYNVIPGVYEVRGWMSGYNSNFQTASVDANSELSDVNLILTNDANVTISGSITFLATENIEVDISFVHPKTRETIPGLNTYTSTGNYSISNVPDGTYLGRASFANDNIVMDPDWIVKNGEPYITVDGADNILNFSVTNAVPLIGPTNQPISVSPVEISIGTAIFSWEPYASASEYVIEVMDANGDVIWGGFSGDWSTRNVVVPSSQTSVDFNFDNTANEALIPGEIYRWKVYASKDDKQSATGWRLISASEDQMGLFSIVD